MKKTKTVACILSLVCSVMLTTAVIAERGEINLSLADLFPFSMHTTVDGTQFTTVTENAPESACLIAAAYKDGRLAETKTLAADGGTYTFAGVYDSVKVFVFDSIGTLKPLAEAETVTIG